MCGSALSWALIGCRSAPPLPPGYISVGLEDGPITLDPRFATDATASQVGDLLYDGLTRLDDQSRRLPQLARSWDIPDPQTYIFHLQEGFQFSNGRPVTAADVAATYDAVRDPRTHSPKQQGLQAIAAIEVLDTLTVRFRLHYPFAPFLNETGLGILCAAQIASAPAHALALPAGSGPFRLVEFTPDERVVVARNPAYPLGAPWLAGIVFTRPGTTFQYLGMNLHDARLADVRVRQAIAHAIDRQAIIRTLLKGLATPASGLLPPTHWAYNAQVTTYAYDPNRAKELLDAAGYSDPDGDGPALRFRLSYKTTTVDLRRRIAEVFQQQLAAVGIGLDIRTYEWATFYNDIKKGDFQLYSLAWVGIEDPDIYYLTCHSSQTPPEGSNRGGFHEESIDALTTTARRTLDREERVRLYAEVQSRLAELVPTIPLWWTTNVAAMHRRLRGYEIQPNASYVSLKDAWIEEP